MEIDLSTLEVGDSVELRNKKIIEITKFNIDKGGTYPYMLNESFYMKNGKYFEDVEFSYDVIKIIKKEKFKIDALENEFLDISKGSSSITLPINNNHKYEFNSLDKTIKIIKKEKRMQKRKFQVGDKVKCIKDFDHLKSGEEAILEPFENGGEPIFPIHKKFPSGSELYGYEVNHYHEHFELIEPNKLSEKHLKWLKEADEFPVICPPLKPEDLKVGMVFSNVINYFKIITIYKKYVIVEVLRIYDNEMYCLNEPIETFLRCTKLIDKVPPKIVEIEEEIPIYMENTDYKKLKEDDYCVVSVNNFSTSSDKIELCKIKRTVKKELEFNWEKGIYE